MSRVSRIRLRTYQVLWTAQRGDRPSRIFDIGILSLIVLNVVSVILETVPEVYEGRERLFYYFEVFSVAIFTVEYIGRLWSCVEDRRFGRRLLGRISFAFTPLMVVDLLAILPFYFPLLITVDLRVLRILRLVRIFRLLKLGRYVEALQILGRVFRSKKEELVITGFVVLVLLVLASSCMYYAEHEAQPETFPSIPAAMWWGIATLSTVGYGDVVPVTLAGKLIGAIVALLGIGMFALPAGILGGAFADEMRARGAGIAGQRAPISDFNTEEASSE